MARRRKTLANGRNAHGGFLRLDHGILDSEAWRHLSPRAVVLLLAVWRRHTGGNNGAIPYSIREARELLGCGPNTAREAFGELVGHGFLKVARGSNFDLKTREAREWTLTMERVGEQPATRDFRDWRQSTVTPSDTVERPPRRPQNQITVTPSVTHGNSDGYRRADDSRSGLVDGNSLGYRQADSEPATVTPTDTLSRSTMGGAADSRASSKQQPAAEHHEDVRRRRPEALADRTRGERLAERRQRAGITPGELARRLGMSADQIERLEAGRSGLSKMQSRRLDAVLTEAGG